MKKHAIALSISFVLLIPGFLFPQVRGQAKMLGVVLDEESGLPVEGVTVKPYFRDTDTYVSPFPRPTRRESGRPSFSGRGYGPSILRRSATSRKNSATGSSTKSV